MWDPVAEHDPPVLFPRHVYRLVVAIPRAIELSQEVDGANLGVVAEDPALPARRVLAVAEGESERGADENPRGVEQPAVSTHAVRYHSRPMTRDEIARQLVDIVRKEKQVPDDK